MVRCCSVYKCKSKQKSLNDKGQKVSFHTFPNVMKSPQLYKEWLHKLSRKNFTPSKATFVCSEHFLPDDFEITNNIKLRLMPGSTSRPFLKETAVPSLNMSGPGSGTPQKRNCEYIKIKEREALLSEIPVTPTASGSGCKRKRSTATKPQIIDRENDLIDDASRSDMTIHNVEIPICSLSIEIEIQCELGCETFRSCNTDCHDDKDFPDDDVNKDMSYQASENVEDTYRDSDCDNVSVGDDNTTPYADDVTSLL